MLIFNSVNDYRFIKYVEVCEICILLFVDNELMLLLIFECFFIDEFIFIILFMFIDVDDDIFYVLLIIFILLLFIILLIFSYDNYTNLCILFCKCVYSYCFNINYVLI